MTQNLHESPVVEVKSCFRCGNEFRTTERERVCGRCRKPKRRAKDSVDKELSFRQKQIVDLVAQGHANKEIAFRLLLAEGTVKEYMNRIFRKVEVSNRTELAIWALRRRSAVEERFQQSRPAFEEHSRVI